MVPAGEALPGTGDFTWYDARDPIFGLSGESPATAGTPKAQAPPGNAQAHERQIAGSLESGGRRWRPPTEGERRRRRPISQVTGQRAARASYACRHSIGFRSTCDTTNPAIRPAPEARRQDRRLRRLGHAAAVRLADRGAPCRAPRRRRLRRLAHVRRRPQGCAREAIPPAAPRQRRRQAEGAWQGALRLHAQ